MTVFHTSARLVARASLAAPRLSARSYATGARAAAGAPAGKDVGKTPMASQTGESDLHPLPASVRGSGANGRTAPTPTATGGNSTAPEDLSSRPAAPGPSAPHVDPSVAAPSHVQRAGAQTQDWATSFSGMSSKPFDGSVAEVLSAPLAEEDIEIKPDGLIYLPEIKYRRILTRAFGPGGWGLAPRGETNVGQKIVSREWVLVCLGRFVSTARGEQEYFNPSGVATASEGAKSNALMRCCKDLGIASELWDPRFIRTFKKKHCVEVFCENASDGKKKKLWRRKDQPPFEWPWKESK